ncbi:MAG: hypothetical protein QE487_02035 [Fluviicola sp.]|nr:hypothetical protein [Fluviicola sp.]
MRPEQNNTPNAQDVNVDSNETKKQVSTKSFSEFWSRFRTAVLNSDTTAVTAMTEFPFRTRGPLDDYPIVEYNKEQFPVVFWKFLKQWSGLDLEGTTELEEIKKATPKESATNIDYINVADLEFRKINDEWRFTFIYLNEETIEELPY